MRAALRPIERRVIELVDDGVDPTEIARRFRRSPAHIERVLGWARLPGRSGHAPMGDVLRPIERRVLRLQQDGVSFEEQAKRFRRTPEHLRRVADLARYKLGL